MNSSRPEKIVTDLAPLESATYKSVAPIFPASSITEWSHSRPFRRRVEPIERCDTRPSPWYLRCSRITDADSLMLLSGELMDRFIASFRTCRAPALNTRVSSFSSSKRSVVRIFCRVGAEQVLPMHSQAKKGLFCFVQPE